MSWRFILFVVPALFSEGSRLNIRSLFDSSVSAPIAVDNWRQRVLTCDTPWTGLKAAMEVAASQDNMNVSLGQYIANQIQERISTEGHAINQGWEGLCSIVAVENILVLENPDRFANIVADLYCNGVVGKDRGLSREIRVRSKVLECRKTAKGEVKGDENSNDALYHLEDSDSGKIRAVDWMFAAPFADAAKSFSTPCESKGGQGQTTEAYKKVSDWVFPTSQVKQKGGEMTAFKRDLLWQAQHLSSKSWSKILQNVRDGGQAILGIDTKLQDATQKGTANHAIVLTKVIDSTMLTDACASSLADEYQDKASCVIWTWAKYYVFEDCDNLRKMTQDAVVVLPEEGIGKIGPSLLQQPDFLEQLEFNIRSMWFFRRTGNWKPESLTFTSRSFKFLKQQQFRFVPRIDIGSKQKKAPLVQDSLACMQTVSIIKDCLPCGLWPGRSIYLRHSFEGFDDDALYAFNTYEGGYGRLSKGGEEPVKGLMGRRSMAPLSRLSIGSIVSHHNASTSTLATVIAFKGLSSPLVSVQSGSKEPEWVPKHDVVFHFLIGDVVSYHGQMCTIVGLTDTGLIKIRTSDGAGDISEVPFDDLVQMGMSLSRPSCHLQYDPQQPPTDSCV